MAPFPLRALHSAATFAFNKLGPIALHSARSYSTTPSQDGATEEATSRREYSESRVKRVSSDWEMTRVREERDAYREEVLDDIELKMDSLPKSKFQYIDQVPISVQSMFEDVASSGIINGGFKSIFDPAEIVKNSQLLMGELTSLSKRGDPNAIAILQLIKDVAMGKVTHAHIAKGMPKLHFSGFRDESLQAAIAPFIKIDNNTTPPLESYRAALEHGPSTVLAWAIFNAMSKNQFPTKYPVNCFRTTNAQPLYTQKKSHSAEIPTASALVGIYADKSVITYLADADQIVKLLKPEELEFAMQKRFYYPVSVFGTEPSAADQFSIISKLGNGYSIRLEDGIFVGQDPKGEGHKKYNLLMEKLDYATVRLLERKLITEIPLETSGFVLKDPHRTSWGRYDINEGYVKMDNDAERFVTSQGKERKVMNLNATTVRSEVPRSRVEKSAGGALDTSDVLIGWQK